MPIDVALIIEQARQLHGLDVDHVRAAELAAELQALVEHVSAAAMTVSFDDEPQRFLFLLREFRDK